MPLRIAPYEQQTAVSMVGQPRASAPALVNPIGSVIAEVAADFHKVTQQRYQAQREADLQDRIGKATAEVSKLEFSLERDQDFRTAPQRFQEGSDAIRDKYLDGVKDSAVATAFRRQYQQFSLAKSFSVQKAAFAKEKDYNVATLDSNIDTYATEAANATNPAVAAFVEQQARLAISSSQTGGWISAEEAGKRERTFLNKRDSSIVIRDMGIDPMVTATKLSIDPTYAANVDPVQRERYADQAFRRAQTDQNQRDAAAERSRKARGDELMKEALKRQNDGTLNGAYVEQIRPFVEPTEYKSLLAGLSGADRKDDPQAFSELQGLVYSNPDMAERRAFVLHQQGRIRNETLASTLTRAREVGRTEGPRTEYERSRQFITNAIKPSDMVPDPASSARYALAIREFDDYKNGGQRKDEEIRAKADEILKRYSMVSMVDLARQTAAGNQPSPQEQIDANIVEASRLMEKLKLKQIPESEFKRRMGALEKSTAAAEKAKAANGGK